MAVWSASLVLIVFLAALQATATEEIKNCEPAAIIKQARRTLYFQLNGDASLPCMAKGNSTLKYTWLKDGEELDITTPDKRERMTIVPGVGTLQFMTALKSDAGVYQCKVTNPCGVSLSTKTKLLHAFIDPFPPQPQPVRVKRPLGKSLKLKCDPPTSVPNASISWILMPVESYEDEMDELFVELQMSRRITMDYFGNLYFVTLLPEDEQDGKRYVCAATNNKLRSMYQGEDKIIEVDGEGPAPNEPALLQWSSETEVMALEGSKAKFKCIFSGNPTPYVRWSRVGGEVVTERMQQTDHQHEFIITNIQPEDAGLYQCSGENPMMTEPERQTFTLSVESRPRWTKRPDDMKVGVEDNVTVVCSVDANPEATIQWFINGVPVEEMAPSKNRQVHNTAMVFTNLTQEDSQVIQCNASNIHGYLWTDAYLQVEALAPTIRSEPTEQKVVEGSNITIPCGVEGKPKPRVVWYKGDQLLGGGRYQVLPNGDLQMKGAEIWDSDNYRCVATNRFGEASSEGSLQVRGKTQITAAPTDDEVNFGEPAFFTCSALTDAQETVRLRYIWLKDGQEIDEDDPRVRITDGRLQISDTASKDTGEYTCIATNDLDRDEAVATLHVKAPPDPPTNVWIASCGAAFTDVEWAFEDSQANFSPLLEFIVEYSTSHNPDVWSEAKRVFPESRRLTYRMSPWTTYTFRVRARNDMGVGEPGMSTDNVCTSAESRPYNHPSDVKTVGDRTGFLVIEWEPMPKLEHNAPGFGYEVTWKAEGDDEAISRTIPNWEQGRFEVPVDGIYQPYQVSVGAFNRIGDAVVSPVPVSGHSGEAAPTVAPANFELDPEVALTATSAGFRWDHVDTSPEALNGKFQGYKIRYWKKNQKDTTMHEELIVVPESHQRRRRRSADKVRGQVSQLPSFSEVEAEVMVVNTYFSSPASNVITFTTPEGVPSRVTYMEALFRGSSHFLLEWGPPVDMNGILIGYELGYQKIAGLTLSDVVIFRDDVPPSQQRITMDGLEPNTLYRAYVAGKTKGGRGERYFIDVRTTDEKSELAEPKIEEVLASQNTANVTFSLTDAEKGERTGSVYYLEYRRLGENLWDREREGATDHFWLELQNLEPATAYEVRVVSVPKTADEDSTEFKPSLQTRFHTSGILRTPKPTENDAGGAKKGSFLSAAWFIAMMAAIALLLLILIVVCIVKRNRGKEYRFPPERDTVDETPALYGQPPMKSAKNGVQGGAPLPEMEGERIPLGGETDSLDDDGVDPERFNEDGSFIGQYGDTKPAPNSHMV